MKLFKKLKEYLDICYFKYSKKVSGKQLSKNHSNNQIESIFSERKEKSLDYQALPLVIKSKGAERNG